jgi:hypothetical protein
MLKEALMRRLALFALAFGCAAAAFAADKELLLTPDQCKLVYSDLLSKPMKDLLTSVSPEDRSKFLAQHPGLDRQIGWVEPAAPAPAAGVLSEQEQAAKDKELAKEAAIHIRPAGPADPAPAAETPAPQSAASPALPGFESPAAAPHSEDRKSEDQMEKLDSSFSDDE